MYGLQNIGAVALKGVNITYLAYLAPIRVLKKIICQILNNFCDDEHVNNQAYIAS
jgi:hypothetical protein